MFAGRSASSLALCGAVNDKSESSVPGKGAVRRIRRSQWARPLPQWVGAKFTVIVRVVPSHRDDIASAAARTIRIDRRGPRIIPFRRAVVMYVVYDELSHDGCLRRAATAIMHLFGQEPLQKRVVFVRRRNAELHDDYVFARQDVHRLAA